jgi:pimeloyl-ACP methyl ester carboxylesterase
VEEDDVMRPRDPDLVGDAVRDGVRLHYEVHGSGPVTVFLMPTWCAVHSGSWKLQVPHLARHVRVVVADPRGNGRSDRPLDPVAYADEELVADAVAVLDASDTTDAVCVGLSMGARVLLQLATSHPDRVAAAVFVGASVRMAAVAPACWTPPFEGPVRSETGWGRFNAEYWRRDLPGFARWFFGEVFTEPFSSKHVDDAVDWVGETDAETLIAAERAPFLDREPVAGPTGAARLAARVRCPSLVVHGDDDRIVPLQTAELLAEVLGAPLEVVAGGGHCVQARHPVWFNHLLLGFVREVTSGARA